MIGLSLNARDRSFLMDYDAHVLASTADRLRQLESDVRTLKTERELRQLNSANRRHERWVFFMCSGWVIAAFLFFFIVTRTNAS
jgi:hypothetical protein